MTIERPTLYLIYAVPRHQLRRENGTSRRLDSLRACFGSDYSVIDINLLENDLQHVDRLVTRLFIAVGLNNFRYLFLSRKLPDLPVNSNVLVSGIYSAFLGLTLRHVRLSIDLVDSLSLTDVRGVQSLWHCRPIYHCLQFPISFLLERFLLRRKAIQSIFVTTYAEREWLKRLHFDSPHLHVLSNSIDTLLAYSKSDSSHANNCLPSQRSLAFIGSLDWWVNRRMLKDALRLLRMYLNKHDASQPICLNVYGDESTRNIDLNDLPSTLNVVHKGYYESVQEVFAENHAAFLPNSVGRGFQNKLFTCLSIGLPTVAHESMNPVGLHTSAYRGSMSDNPVIFCRTEADYMSAISSVFLMDFHQRLLLRKACHQFLANWHQNSLLEREEILHRI